MSLNFDFSRHLHPFTSFDSFEAHPPRIIESAQGVFIYDSTGKAILDGMSGLWCVNLGYGQERLVEVAAEQMRKLPFYNTFFKTTHPQIEALSHKLASVTPQGIEHFFFANSGSEAIDTAMRTARLYWAWQDRPEKNILISRKNAYHGSSMGGVSLGGMAFMHKQGGPLLTNICHIGQPDWNREGRHTDPQTFGLERARELEAKILEIGQDRVAAFFAEPIQGAGGVIIPPESYWPEIVRICRAYDVLLVSDEVICGFGRTGARFGCQSFQFEPDIMTMAKGLTAGYFPMSCMGISGRVHDVLREKGKSQEYAHGFTWSGHPVGAAIALEALAIWEETDLETRLREETIPAFAHHIQTLGDGTFFDYRDSYGLLGGVSWRRDLTLRPPYDTDESLLATHLREALFEGGVVMRCVPGRAFLAPPLTISLAELETLFERGHAALNGFFRKIQA